MAQQSQKSDKGKESSPNELEILSGEFVASLLYRSYPSELDNIKDDYELKGTFTDDYNNLLADRVKLQRSLLNRETLGALTNLHLFDSDQTAKFQSYNNKVNAVLSNLENAYLESLKNPAYANGSKELAHRLLSFKNKISGIHWTEVIRSSVSVGDEFIVIPSDFKFEPNNSYFDSIEDYNDFMAVRFNPISGGFNPQKNLTTIKEEYGQLLKLSEDKELATKVEPYLNNIFESLKKAEFELPEGIATADLAKWFTTPNAELFLPEENLETLQPVIQGVFARLNQGLYEEIVTGAQGDLRVKADQVKQFEKALNVNLDTIQSNETFLNNTRNNILLRSPITVTNPNTGETTQDMGSAIDLMKEQHFQEEANLLQIMSDYGNSRDLGNLFLGQGWERNLNESLTNLEQAAKPSSAIPTADIISYPDAQFMRNYSEYEGTNSDWIDHFRKLTGSKVHMLAGEYQSGKKSAAEVWAENRQVKQNVYKSPRVEDKTKARTLTYNYMGSGYNDHVSDAVDYINKIDNFVLQSVKANPLGQIQTGTGESTAMFSNRAPQNYDYTVAEGLGMPVASTEDKLKSKSPDVEIKTKDLSIKTDTSKTAQKSVADTHGTDVEQAEKIKAKLSEGSKDARIQLRKHR